MLIKDATDITALSALPPVFGLLLILKIIFWEK
jgi:hypothetical protein